MPITWTGEPGEVPRDRWGRPGISPPEGGALVPYKRASSLGGILEDQYNLTLWKQRMTALGMASNRSFVTRVAAARDNKSVLNDIVAEAVERAGGSDQANLGTALHALTEQYDRGTLADHDYADWMEDIEAYANATATVDWHLIEQFIVCDELQAAGTPDRVGTIHEPLTFENGVTLPVGWTGVFDLKTGSVDYPHSFAVQLAIYAHGLCYDPVSLERTPLPENVSKEHAVLIHLPAGRGMCEFHLLDIDAGLSAAYLALDVDKWRKTKNLTSNAVRI